MSQTQINIHNVVTVNLHRTSFPGEKGCPAFDTTKLEVIDEDGVETTIVLFSTPSTLKSLQVLPND